MNRVRVVAEMRINGVGIVIDACNYNSAFVVEYFGTLYTGT
jgi:hypothetical protein